MIRGRFGAKISHFFQRAAEVGLSFTLNIADTVIVIESGKFVREYKRADVDEEQIYRYLSV